MIRRCRQSAREKPLRHLESVLRRLLPSNPLANFPVKLSLGKDTTSLYDAHSRDAKVVVLRAHELGEPLVAVAEGVLAEEIHLWKRGRGRGWKSGQG